MNIHRIYHPSTFLFLLLLLLLLTREYNKLFFEGSNALDNLTVTLKNMIFLHFFFSSLRLCRFPSRENDSQVTRTRTKRNSRISTSHRASLGFTFRLQNCVSSQKEDFLAYARLLRRFVNNYPSL